MMRSEMETSELNKPPPPPERAPPKTIRWDFDYIRDELPTVQLYNHDIRHRAQTLKRQVNALDRHWNYHAHGPPRHPRRHTQQSAQLYNIFQ